MRNYTQHIAVAAIMFDLACLSATSAQAATVVQTGHWDTSEQLTPGSGSFSFSTTSLNKTLDPFNTALGTLERVTIVWSFGLTISGIAGENATVYMQLEPTGWVNTTQFATLGWAEINLQPLPGTFQSSSTVNYGDSMNFTAANAGFTCNPAFWPIVSGASTFEARLDGGLGYATYSSLTSGTVTRTIDLVATYTYAAVPAPGAAALIGLAGMVATRRRRN